jgi:hypothetical protein
MTTEQPATLDDVIGAGDAINHAIFTIEEIVLSVQRMVGSGLLEVKPDSFQLTSAGQQLLDRRTGGLIGQTASVQKPLRTVIAQTAPWTMETSRIATATKRYLEGMGSFDSQAPRT